MKMKKLFLALILAAVTFSLSSCLDGDNSASYTNVYGYVVTSSGVTYVATSPGYAITWSGISDNLTAGQTIRISFSMDYTTLNGVYAAQNVDYDPVTSYSINDNSNMIAVNDSNFVTSMTVAMYDYSSWFGDNWFLTYYTQTANGKAVEPVFYYSTSAADNFNVDSDSLIIDVRLKVTGTTSSTTNTGSCAVDLSDIRTLFTASGDYAGDYIPIYFRYYTASGTYKTTTKTTYGMYISE